MKIARIRRRMFNLYSQWRTDSRRLRRPPHSDLERGNGRVDPRNRFGCRAVPAMAPVPAGWRVPDLIQVAVWIIEMEDDRRWKNLSAADPDCAWLGSMCRGE